MIRVTAALSLACALLLSALPASADDAAAKAAAAAKKKAAAFTKDKAEAEMDELGDPTRMSTSATERRGQLALQFLDALTGNPIPGGSVTFGSDTVTTDDRGVAKFPFPPVPDSADTVLDAVFQKAGARTIGAGAGAAAVPESARGYITAKVPLHFMAGTIWNHRFSISPQLDPGKLRVVLDWGETPPDLDAHLVKGGDYHISFRELRNYKDLAKLDRDAMQGFGPETVTIERLDASGAYTFQVHDYTNRGVPGAAGLGSSRARVMVFGDQTLLNTFVAPKGAGTVWTVFRVEGGVVKAVNTLGDKVAAQ
jgi:hypothetical protein